MMHDILQRYDNNCEKIDQFTLNCLKRSHDCLSGILRKPISMRASGTFIRTSFRKWKYIFDYTCQLCRGNHGAVRLSGAIAWFKIFSNSLAVNPIIHLESQMHQNTVSGLQPDHIIPAVEDINNNQPLDAVTYLEEIRQEELAEQVETGLQLAKDTPYERISNYLTAELGDILGDITISAFGSRVMGIASPESDVDLHIDSRYDNETAYRLAHKWAKRLEVIGNLKIRRHIPRGPLLIRIDVNLLGLELDLTFGGSSYVVDNAYLIEYFFIEQPLAPMMYFMLKDWKNKIGVSANFHSHMLVMLLVFYMQLQGYLPPVSQLLNGPHVLQDNTFNTNFRRIFTAERFPGHLLMLARGFFKYWAEFDWTRNGICAFDGQVKPKTSMRFVPDRLTPMMCSDYFNRSRNVASNIKPDDYEIFKRACKRASKVMLGRRSML